MHVSLEDLQDSVDGLGPPHDVLQHLLGGHEMPADQMGHLLGDLLLPLQKHALDIDVPAAHDVRLHRTEDQRDAQPVCEVPDDQARHGQDHESSPAPETVFGALVLAIELPTAVQYQPEQHLQDTQEEAHDSSHVLDEGELPGVLEDLDEEHLVVHQYIYGHLLDVDDSVHVGLQIRDDRVEHDLALLEDFPPELLLHAVWQRSPQVRAMTSCKPGQHSGAGLPKRCVQTLEEVLGLDAVDDLLKGDEVPNHDIAAAARHDVCTPGHNALPTQERRATAFELHWVEHHLDPEPDVPPSEGN
mmetsp:Transcript_143280/g.399430  ORF Transcript_143280/g.399430 Transcript_143280/m.399430 type:complete len:301 (-) Transcript_143280:43-945(-)